VVIIRDILPAPQEKARTNIEIAKARQKGIKPDGKAAVLMAGRQMFPGPHTGFRDEIFSRANVAVRVRARV
jgi:hypothetical protein